MSVQSVIDVIRGGGTKEQVLEAVQQQERYDNLECAEMMEAIYKQGTGGVTPSVTVTKVQVTGAQTQQQTQAPRPPPAQPPRPQAPQPPVQHRR